MSSAEEPTVEARISGRAGLLLMNRPRALNALDAGMIASLAAQATAWRGASPDLVLLEGAGGKAFCAGGDVRAMRALALSGDAAGIERFFVAEYGLNRAIAEFGKPWVSLIDGICMGGGIGVSVHGSHRIVTSHALLAMPETAIGFFPDVGTSYALPRLPGAIGMWLGLTGARLQGSEAVEAGLATHLVARGDLPALRAALAADGVTAVARFAEAVPPGRIAALRPLIDRCFGAGSVPAIVAALEAEGGAWAAEQLAALRRLSPTALFVTHELLTRGRGLDLAGCLEMELALTRRVCFHPDFAEGVRAVLVDKDNAPRWSPAAIGEVRADAVAALFG
jgi:enoyl-CoA hydratase